LAFARPKAIEHYIRDYGGGIIEKAVDIAIINTSVTGVIMLQTVCS
jgi:hypothetical protein